MLNRAYTAKRGLGAWILAGFCCTLPAGFLGCSDPAVGTIKADKNNSDPSNPFGVTNEKTEKTAPKKDAPKSIKDKSAAQ